MPYGVSLAERRHSRVARGGLSMTSAKPSPVEELNQEFRRRLEDSRAALLRTLAQNDEETAVNGGELRGPGEVASEESGRVLLGELAGKGRRELGDIED